MNDSVPQSDKSWSVVLAGKRWTEDDGLFWLCPYEEALRLRIVGANIMLVDLVEHGNMGLSSYKMGPIKTD